MAKTEEAVKKALGTKKKGDKLHTHSVHYERADNGGVHATVHRHTKAGPHHTEHHVLPDMESAQHHLQEHMGDQPGAGEMEPQAEAANEQEPEPAMPGGGAQAGM